MKENGANSPQDALTLNGVTKSYNNQKVLNGISTSFAAGELCLLLGHNGSGKSTLLRIAAGLIRADSGKITTHDSESKSVFGYVSHKLLLYSDLSVEENLNFFRAMSGSSANLSEIISEWELQEHSTKRISALSKGLQFRVSCARAFLANPKILLLDEPTSSLDDRSLSMLITKVRAHVSAGAAAIIATHDIARTLGMAQRVILLSQGQIEYDSKLNGSENAKQKGVELYRANNR